MLYVDQAAFGAAVEAMLVCLSGAKDRDGLAAPISARPIGNYGPAADAMLRMMQDYAGLALAVSADQPVAA